VDAHTDLDRAFPPLLTIRKVAKRLDCSPGTVENLLRRPSACFPRPIRVGHTRKWLEADIETWLLTRVR
jgi:predicted DNA-binding transcriptional regulator AlpA